MRDRVRARSARAFVQGLAAVTLLSAGAVALAYTKAQAANGKTLYVNVCAACHGMDLRGGEVPKQFGEDSGNKVPALAGPQRLSGFFSAVQIFNYAKTRMPGQNPGSLTTEEYLDLTAFLIQVNDLAPPDGNPISVERLSKIPISHPPK